MRRSKQLAGSAMAPAATRKTPSRGIAQRVGYPRLGTLTRYIIALRYAMGEKTHALAEEFGTSSGYVSTIAVAHGLARRGHRPRLVNPDEIQRLKKSATLRAEALKRAAAEWLRLAQ